MQKNDFRKARNQYKSPTGIKRKGQNEFPEKSVNRNLNEKRTIG